MGNSAAATATATKRQGIPPSGTSRMGRSPSRLSPADALSPRLRRGVSATASNQMCSTDVVVSTQDLSRLAPPSLGTKRDDADHSDCSPAYVSDDVVDSCSLVSDTCSNCSFDVEQSRSIESFACVSQDSLGGFGNRKDSIYSVEV